MKDDTAPATKADVAALMDSIGRLYDANERWKNEILAANERWKDEILRHFDVRLEQIRHDLEGALRDVISLAKDCQQNHERRITRLERRVGIAA